MQFLSVSFSYIICFFVLEYKYQFWRLKTEFSMKDKQHKKKKWKWKLFSKLKKIFFFVYRNNNTLWSNTREDNKKNRFSIHFVVIRKHFLLANKKHRGINKKKEEEKRGNFWINNFFFATSKCFAYFRICYSTREHFQYNFFVFFISFHFSEFAKNLKINSKISKKNFTRFKLWHKKLS